MEISASEFTHNVKKYSLEAQKEPIFIERHKRKAVVLLSHEMYMKLFKNKKIGDSPWDPR